MKFLIGSLVIVLLWYCFSLWRKGREQDRRDELFRSLAAQYEREKNEAHDEKKNEH
jgi:hypothetical protein